MKITQLGLLLGFVFLGLALASPNFRYTNAPQYTPFPDMVKALNYPCETHDITTDDGYILTFFRMQAKNQGSFKTGLPVVYLQHGLLDSGDTWVVDDENDAPGYRLANSGFDVWIGNSRGTKYSMSHVSLNSSDPLFWQFTFQNMSQYDLPAAFKYINGQTGQMIHYIGHSQGTLIMFASLSERDPVVTQYLKSYVALSPVAWVADILSGPIELVAHTSLATLMNEFHINEFAQPNFLESDFGHIFCKAFSSVCGNFLGYFFGANPTYDNYNQYNLILEHEPGGTSVMNMLHWRQLVLSKRFCKYDYGNDGNLLHYNQASPPDYDVPNINFPVNLFFGTNDSLVSPQDTQTLLTHLTGTTVNYKEYPADHITWIWGKNISMWYGDLMNILQNGTDIQYDILQ